jgi:hypothetical protein
MDTKKKIRLSLAEWKEISSGLELSPGDLARAQRLDDNLADSLEDWGNKSEELLTRVIEHHSACMSKILKKQKRGN